MTYLVQWLECCELPLSEADTCRIRVTPKLKDAGWKDEQIAEQRTFTDGRITVSGRTCRRGPQKRADYILRIKVDFSIAVVEAKAADRIAADGLQQAKEYALVLGLKFAYATNGTEILEHDFTTGLDLQLDSFPGPEDLWKRFCESEAIREDQSELTSRLLTPNYRVPGKRTRYYQEIAINRAVQAIASGRKRVLLTMATGTGKTYVAFQIIHRLWTTRWNRSGQHQRPRVLFLADRDVLVGDPLTKEFSAFGDAKCRIQGKVVKSRDIYFATYQTLAKDAMRLGLYKEYEQDFFDLIVVDECHRGSARDDSNWREILEYFEPAFQLGMTATPKRDDNIDTYRYFGNPVYTYSLKQGIDDGFLAPYNVYRVVTTVDALGWRPQEGEEDKKGRLIPDKLYGTPDFEKKLSMKSRNEAIAKHLTEFMKKNGRYDKTIVFCVDQEHASQMHIALSNLNADLVQKRPDYVCRIVSDEGDVGRKHLSNFMDIEKETPVIVTTSKLLTTGVDVPLCKNVVIARMINSMVEFKQTIGRGTRVRDDYGKLTFNIFDYTGSATKLFADPEFDGYPTLTSEEIIDDEGHVESKTEEVEEPLPEGALDTEEPSIGSMIDETHEPRWRDKYYVDGSEIRIAADQVYEIDPSGSVLKVVKYTDYTADQIREIYTASSLKSKWKDRDQRLAIIETLQSRGVTLEHLMESARMPEIDPFDLLCHIAFSAPLRTRRERAERVRNEEQEFFAGFQPAAREILREILDKYEQFGVQELADSKVFRIRPLSVHGTLREIAALFGGAKKMLSAMNILQNLVYSF